MDQVKKAIQKDLVSVRKLNASLRLSEVTNFYWDTEAYIRSAIAEERCFIVGDDPMIKGAMIIEKRDPDGKYDQDSLAVGTLVVHPAFRDEGIGARLVEAAKELAVKYNKRLYVESFYDYGQLN